MRHDQHGDAVAQRLRTDIIVVDNPMRDGSLRRTIVTCQAELTPEVSKKRHTEHSVRQQALLVDRSALLADKLTGKLPMMKNNQYPLTRARRSRCDSSSSRRIRRNIASSSLGVRHYWPYSSRGAAS